MSKSEVTHAVCLYTGHATVITNLEPKPILCSSRIILLSVGQIWEKCVKITLFLYDGFIYGKFWHHRRVYLYRYDRIAM